MNKIIFYCTGLLFYTKFFQYSFFHEIFMIMHAFFVVVCAMYLLYFLKLLILDNIYHKTKFRTPLIYVICLSLLVPLYGAINSYSEFQQPFIYGILSLRAWWSIGFSFFIYHQMKTKKITLNFITDCLIYCGFFSIIFYLFSLAFIDFESFDGIYIREGDSRGARLRYSDIFTIFSLLFYVNKVAKKFNYLDLFNISLFILYFTFISQSRSILVSLFVTSCTIILYYSKSLSSFIARLLYILLFISFSIIMLIIFSPSQLQSLTFLFESLLALFTDINPSDPSSASRITSSLLAYSFLTKDIGSLIFGAGQFSVQYYGGLSEFIGWYFYPSDVGILGGIYTFGLLGLIFLMVIPLLFSLKIIYNFLSIHSGSYFSVYAFNLINILILNIAQGRLFFMPFMFYLSILLMIYACNNRKIYT